jgi:hypothetical protein
VEVLCFLPSKNYPLYDFDLRATRARTLLPKALASVSFGFGFVLVRVQVASFEIRKQTAKKTLSFAYFHGDTEKNLRFP